MESYSKVNTEYSTNKKANCIFVTYMENQVFNTSEKEEKDYLEIVKAKLEKAILDIDHLVRKQAKDIKDLNEYLEEHKTGMDHIEKISVRESIAQTAMTGEHSVGIRKRLLKLQQIPYFGRIDFKITKNTNPYYIGIHSFLDRKENRSLIHDWRAPVSSMFYDFELGEAHYEDGKNKKVKGEITLKRQYKIRRGKLEFMLESAVNIQDEILQKELSQTSNEKMKNIVATIQRSQNKIIRNSDAQAMVIQGVAGSGKTSIALHRIAFLLYKFKDSIASKEILIISPNKVFGNYISSVLPELGEEQMQETGMEELANRLLETKYKFQTFFEQVTYLLEDDDEAFKNRIRFKSSIDFLKKLDAFIEKQEKENLKPGDIKIKTGIVIPAWFIEQRFKAYHNFPMARRLTQVVKDCVENVSVFYGHNIEGKRRQELRETLGEMFKTVNLKTLYKTFFDWMQKPEMFQIGKGLCYEYADVFPLVYLKMKLEGIKTYQEIKHLVIDEMQDYTPVQYKVLSELFSCKKTILGDSNQSVNPYSSSSAEAIKEIFPNAAIMYLNKSYRSTFEITEFSQKIQANKKLEAVERHGEHPKIVACKNNESENKSIKESIEAFLKTDYKAMGIICKTQNEATSYFKKLKDSYKDIYLLNAESALFENGIIVCTAHMAKGLEFDKVIVPNCSKDNYKKLIDRHMLYVACTRAMHQLELSFYGEKSIYLP